MHKLESIKLVQYYCNCVYFTWMHHFEKIKFVAQLHKTHKSDNDAIKVCLTYFIHTIELKKILVQFKSNW